MKRVLDTNAQMSGDMLLLIQYLRDDWHVNPVFTFTMDANRPFFYPVTVGCRGLLLPDASPDQAEHLYEIVWYSGGEYRLDQVMYKALSGLVETVNAMERASYHPQA